MKFQAPASLREVLQQYERLWNTDADTYARALSHLWDFVRHGNQDEAIGAHIGAQFSPREHLRSDLILSSQTMRHAIERGFAFYNAANPHSSYALGRRDSGCVLLVRHRRPSGTIRHDTEKRLALLATLIRWFDSQDRAPLMVHLRAPRPEYDSELKAIFGCAVAYSQKEDAVVVEQKVMDIQIWGSEYAALRFRDLIELPAEVARRPATLGERVADAIREGLSRGRGGIKNVAGEFGVSPRTLERRLAEASVSYRAILEAVRFERCLQLLQLRGLPTRELADLLGFSNSSNFHRAFCRWFALEPDALSVISRVAASDARKALSPREMWIAASGPRPCPFASARCSPQCTIHPRHWKQQS
jgi:AraC-like DNA-binding protein